MDLQAHLAQLDDQVLVVVVVEHRGDLLMALVLVVGYPVGQPLEVGEQGPQGALEPLYPCLFRLH